VSFLPRRLVEQTGRWSLVDGIAFQLPVASKRTPALMAAFAVNADAAKRLLPGNELHPFRLRGRGLLVITVVDYRETNIGKYIEYSIAIACTHGRRPAPAFLPLIFQKHYQLGQYVFDLPVSTEVSVKGGKGIWGMPKHRANLDFVIADTTVSSQYDLDGRLAVNIEIDRPKTPLLPIFNLPGANFCAYRGMLYRSNIYFTGKIGLGMPKKGSARLTIGDHPRVAPLKSLDIDPNPIFTAFLPDTHGVLDDHFECWFLSYDSRPTVRPEGMESVAGLGQGQEWLAPPNKSNLP